MASRYAVIAVGFNRPEGLQRLLASLEAAYYDEEVDLIVSIDYTDNAESNRAAKAFDWTHGRKTIRSFPERQGLRKHILSCGVYLDVYEAVAVFEDDLIASPAFFNYMKQSADYYQDNDDIAGISLYSHRLNPVTYLPFEPEHSGKDVYLIQYAPSWGQVWMRRQWKAFMEWYRVNEDCSFEGAHIPPMLKNWQHSWLKYHIKYSIECNKYFVYPYAALSTCFNDPGEHSISGIDYFQVPLMPGIHKEYSFGSLDELAVYDAFFERKGLGQYLNIPESDLCTDLYGARNNAEGKRYWLTRIAGPYRIMSSYALDIRPHEANIRYGMKGNDLFLYDTSVQAEAPVVRRREYNYKTISYYYNISISWKLLLDFLETKIGARLRRLVNKRKKQKG